MTGDDQLTVALTHLAPRRGRDQANRATFRSALRSAAQAGARLVIGPELTVAGYGFTDRSQAQAAAEPLDGPTVQAIGQECAQLDVFAVVGILEDAGGADTATGEGTLYNTAVILGPSGVLDVHRKLIVPERTWATPGSRTVTIVPTPFGRMAVLICADSYYAGPPRACALAGADLLVVPSAWPADELDPVDIWRERARQNGIPVLACNRTGVDGDFDARTSPSAVITPTGAVQVHHVSVQEDVVLAAIPLTGGRIAHRRPEALAARDTQLWRSALREPAVPHASPDTPLNLHIAVDPEAAPAPGPDVIVLPADRSPVSVDGSLVVGADAEGAWATDQGEVHRQERGEALVVSYQARRVGVLTQPQAHHPEVLIGLVRRGCDLVAVCATAPVPDDVRRLGVAALERAVVAHAAPGRAVLACPPLACEAAAVQASSARTGIRAPVTTLSWDGLPPSDDLDREVP